VIPAIIALAPPTLVRSLGGRVRLQLLMEYLHDWTLGDVLLLAYIIMWLTVLSIKWTNPEVYYVGGYFMVFFGVSSGFMIYLFQLNACIQPEESSKSEKLELLDSESDSSQNEETPQAKARPKVEDQIRCPLGARWRCLLYLIIFGLYGGAAAAILHAFRMSSKPSPDVRQLEDLNQAFQASVSDEHGLLHIANSLLLGSNHLGSLGSCSKKGQEGGPPDNLPCMDVPDFHTEIVKLPLGASLSSFSTGKGGPIYETTLSEGKLNITHLEVAFVTGLQDLQIEFVKLVDRGLAEGGSTRSMQLQVGIVSTGFQKEGSKLSLPILVHLGKETITPCCNPEHITFTLHLNCNRHFPFFTLLSEKESVSISIEPANALTGSGTSSKSEHLFFEIMEKLKFNQEDIDTKLAQLIAQHVTASVKTSSYEDLKALYPYPELTITDGLGFLISSNLPISGSKREWGVCPE
ncbi:unnamed protein product, partial [Polarella glacialis]